MEASMRNRSNLTKTILTAAVALGALLASGTAAAQTNTKDDGKMDIMNFVDADKLVTSGNSASGMTITPGHHPVRILLVRPRLHFVPELIKTIENL
jgi:hypothetical protein